MVKIEDPLWFLLLSPEELLIPLGTTNIDSKMIVCFPLSTFIDLALSRNVLQVIKKGINEGI